MHRLTYHDAGSTLGLSYEQVRRRAQVGELEPAEPLDGKHAVTFRSVAALAAKIGKDIADGPIDLAPFGELQQELTRFHVLGIDRVVFLRSLEANALEAEQRGDLGTAAVYWQLLAGLQQTSYRWNAEKQNWSITMPGVGTTETATPAASVSSTSVGSEPTKVRE